MPGQGGGSRHSSLWAGVLLAADLALAAPAHAATPRSTNPPDCTVAHKNLDTSGGFTTPDLTDMNVGPHDQCATIIALPKGTELWYECSYVNGSGDSWTYARIATTQTYGWVWNQHLDDGGSRWFC